MFESFSTILWVGVVLFGLTAWFLLGLSSNGKTGALQVSNESSTLSSSTMTFYTVSVTFQDFTCWVGEQQKTETRTADFKFDDIENLKFFIQQTLAKGVDVDGRTARICVYPTPADFRVTRTSVVRMKLDNLLPPPIVEMATQGAQ